MLRAFIRRFPWRRKELLGSYYLAYRVYKLFNNGDPRIGFGLAPGTPMYCLYFSTNITTAKRSGFQYLMNIFSNCKWFKDHMPVDKQIESIIRFPNNFEICYASAECVSGESLVYTNRGPVRAMFLEKGDYVWNGARFKKVLSVNQEDNMEFRRVMTQSGAFIDCTLHHKHVTSTGLYNTMELKPGQRLILSTPESPEPVETTVTSITPIEYQTCYGAEVEGGIYCVNGLITHNSHQIGLNIWGFILDESNFRKGVGMGVAEEYDEVTRLYQQLIDRLSSRFSSPEGVNAIAILISSASYQSSFTEKRKEVIKSDSNGHYITAVNYKIKPWQYSSEMFEVFVGAGAVEPSVITDEDHKKSLIASAMMEGLDKEKELIIEVPESLRKTFELNVSLALQNHCGIPY